VLSSSLDSARDKVQQVTFTASSVPAKVTSTFVVAYDAIKKATISNHGGKDAEIVAQLFAQPAEGAENVGQLVVDEVHSFYPKHPRLLSVVFKAKVAVVDFASLATQEIYAFYRTHASLVTAVLLGVGTVLAGRPISMLLLKELGWHTAGVSAGSIAAALQSVIYGAHTCGVFSLLQSAGAVAPLAAATGTANVLALLGGAALVGAAVALWMQHKATRGVARDSLTAAVQVAVSATGREMLAALQGAGERAVRRVKGVRAKL